MTSRRQPKKDHFAHFPEQPPGTQLRVQRTPKMVILKICHPIAPARNKMELFDWILLAILLCLLVATGGFNAIVRLIFFHTLGDWPTAVLLSYWSDLTIFVPACAVSVLTCVFLGRLLVVADARLTPMPPERPDWTLGIWENLWHVTFYPDDPYSDSGTEQRRLKPSEITELGIDEGKFGDDEGGRVYCLEVRKRRGKAVPSRVALTPMLSKAEAAWVEQSLRSLLTLARSAA